MSVFKCKMCGGTLEFEQGASVGICEYCGTKQTLPKLDDDRRANLYDRANHFRRNNEYDKAIGIYEQILNEDNTDAEAYWSLVLCQYGIEYVEDPATHKRVPTVNRAQFTSIFDNNNYKSALQYADGYQKSIYEEEANAINEIQKGILAISQQEQPFDVFICYKETDNLGRRTQDSVLANDLYHQLTNEGFKVFFSRITLEDKLGNAYEPYIFAALNSAKVMVVLGTKPEYFNAVWVKNEWSRYLSLVKESGGKKMLIPAYRDMDPYDLPEEFSHLQAQDMSRLGFMQDMIRGIRKILDTNIPKTTVKETVVFSGSNAEVGSLLKRAFMYLEDGDWANADNYCERILDMEPENANAYLGKLMAELSVPRQSDLKELDNVFDYSNNYQKAIRFAEPELESELRESINGIRYRNAMQTMEKANTEDDFKDAAGQFGMILEYKDSNEKAKECMEKAEIARKDEILSSADQLMNKDGNIFNDKKGYLWQALVQYEKIPGWKDADEKAEACRLQIEEIKMSLAHKAEKKHIIKERIKKRSKRIALLCILVVGIIGIVGAIYYTVILPKQEKEHSVKERRLAELAYEEIKESKVGGIVTFGLYEQDNDLKNGKEAIQWRVLEKKENKVLLISEYGLDCLLKVEGTEPAENTWEERSLRQWLNGEFLDLAFTDKDIELIDSTELVNADNPNHGTDGGNKTTDKVFVLSFDEAEKYFDSDSARQTEATMFAKVRGAYVNKNEKSHWTLRTPGISPGDYMTVRSVGDIIEPVGNSGSDTIRPTIWVNTEAYN